MITSNNKISLLVNSQFPDFVQEDYPLFVRFLEAYYEFLENKITLQTFVATEGQTSFVTTNPYSPEAIDVYINDIKLSPTIEVNTTNGTSIVLVTPASAGDIIVIKSRNDLYTRAKELVSIKDVDQSLTDFQNEFFNTYLNLFPKNTDASKYVLIKNAAELYKSKGNENSFKYFFRTLFNEEIEIRTPKNDVLVASGGNFKIPKVLRTTKNVYSFHSGGQKEYSIAVPKINFPQDPFDGQDYVIFEETYEWNSSQNKWVDTSTSPLKQRLAVYVDDVLRNSSVGDSWTLSDLEKTNKFFNLNSTTNGLNIDTLSRGIYFKSDGLQLYIMGDGSNRITQVSFSEAWNLNSFSATTKVSNPLQMIEPGNIIRNITGPYGIDFKPDGTKVYFVWATDGFNRVLEYNLSESWNIATALPIENAYYDPLQGRILAGVTADTATTINPVDVKFKSDGTRMFVLQMINDTVDEFQLSTAWQVNTATYLRSVSTNLMRPVGTPTLLNPQAMAFKSDGTKIFITSGTSATLYQFNLSEAWNVQSYSFDSYITPDIGFTFHNLLTIRPDGNRFYIGTGQLSLTTDSIHEFKTSSTGEYSLDRERNKIVFPSRTQESSNIKIYYQNFDYSLLDNRRIEGSNSGARAIVESSTSYTNYGTEIFEFELNQKSIFKSFLGNENYKSSILTDDESVIDLIFEPYSQLVKIDIIDGGSRYNIGDPVTIIGGNPIIEAKANVTSVFSGVLNQANVVYGGAGFTQGFPVHVTSSPGTACASITVVDTSGRFSPNTYVYSEDTIWDLAGTLISNANYKTNNCFMKAKTGITPNVNARLIDCFSYKTLSGIGPISNTIVISSTITTNETPILNAASSNVRVNSYSDVVGSRRFMELITMGSVGRIDINSPGTNYSIGEGINIFYPQPPDSRYNPLSNHLRGTGARAYVADVDLSGGITKIDFCPPQPSANVFNGPGKINLSSSISGTYTATGFDGVNFTDHFANGRGGFITFTVGWDFSNTKLTPNQFLVSSQTTIDGSNPEIRGLYLSNTGNRLFILGDFTNKISQIDLRENWNIASFNTQTIKSFTLPGGFNGSGSYSGLKFSPDGRKVYITDVSRPNVVEYALTTTWDISTATYYTNANIAVNGILSSTRDIELSSDGTRLYIIGSGAGGGRVIHEYNMSTPFRVNTATFSRSTALLGDVGDPSGLFFHPKGNTVFVVDRTSDNVYHYNLTQAWNVATISSETLQTFISGLNQTIFVTTNPYPASKIKVFKNGVELAPAEIDITSGTQIVLTSPALRNDVITVTRNSANPSFVQVANMPALLGAAKSESDPTFITFAANGSRMYYGGFQRDTIYELDINSITQTKLVQNTVSSNQLTFTTPSGLYIPNTLILGYSANDISYVRTRTYDVTTLSDNQNYFCSTVSIQSGNNYVEGYRTNFRDDFRVGEEIIVYGQRRIIHTIFSDSTMNVTSAFTVNKSNTREIGVYNTNSLGGDGYRMSNLPLAEVDSFSSVNPGGSGAQLVVTSIIGDGENITMSSNKKPGEIEEIQIIDGGTGYSFVPEVFLTGKGDGTAKAVASIESSFATYPGTYLSSDGHLSSDKKLQSSIFYNTGTYVIKTKQQFEKFRSSILNLIHPSGKYLYCEYSPPESILSNAGTNVSVTFTSVDKV